MIAVVAGKFALAGITKVDKMAGLGSAGEIAEALGCTFGIAAAVVLGKKLGDMMLDEWIPQFQMFAHKQWGWGGAVQMERKPLMWEMSSKAVHLIKCCPFSEAMHWLLLQT